MDRMPLLAVTFQSIPESITIIYLGLASIGIRPNFRRVLAAGVLSSLASRFVRELALPFGLHSLLGLVIITFLFIIIFKIEPLKAVLGAVFAISSLLAAEAVLLPAVTEIAGIAGFSDAWGQPVLRVVLALPELALLAGLAYFMIRFRISFETLAYLTQRREEKE